MSPRLSRASIVALLAGQFLLLTAQVRPGDGPPGLLRQLTLEIVGPLGRIASSAGATVAGWRAAARREQALGEENARLRAELRDLRRERLRLDALELEADDLSEALAFRRRSPFAVRVADVVFADHSAMLRTIIVRVGGEGARANMPVVSADGLVGRVLESSGSFARVQLLIDRAASVGVRLEQADRQGVVHGDADGRLVLDFVKRQVEVPVGDRVLSAGIDGVFPPGLMVGTVTAVEAGNELFHRIVVAPAVDFRRLDHVLLLDWQAPPRELVAPPPADAPRR